MDEKDELVDDSDAVSNNESNESSSAGCKIFSETSDELFINSIPTIEQKDRKFINEILITVFGKDQLMKREPKKTIAILNQSKQIKIIKGEPRNLN